MVNLRELPVGELETMAAAGEQILECYRVLEKSSSNVVAEVLRGQGTLIERAAMEAWRHVTIPT